MRKEILRDLEQEYEQRRAENNRVFFERQQKAEQACPEIGRLLQARQQLIFSGIRGILDRRTVRNIPEQMQEISGKITALLESGGFPADYLEPVYHCPLCKDRGYVGDSVREMCSCMRRELYARLYRSIGLEQEKDESFDSLNLSLFSDQVIPELGCSQRQMMQLIAQVTRNWAMTWPDTRMRGGILLTGSTGLGKTYLMHCIAKVLLERGKEVLVLSMYRAQEIMRRAYVTGEDEDYRMLMDVDVLCLDDLGSEPLIENVTITQLFNLLNERQIRGKAFVISTNLSPQNLRARYTERVTSRLLDKERVEVFEMRGQDIRRS